MLGKYGSQIDIAVLPLIYPKAVVGSLLYRSVSRPVRCSKFTAPVAKENISNNLELMRGPGTPMMKNRMSIHELFGHGDPKVT